MAACRDLLGQLPLHLVQCRLRRGSFLFVRLRERLGLRGLRLGLACRRLLRGLLRLQLRLRLQQRDLVLGQVADDLARVLVACLVQSGRGGKVRGEAGLRRAVDVRLHRVLCHEPPVLVDGRPRMDEICGDRLHSRLRVLEVLLRRVVLVVEDGGLLLLLGQRALNLADLRPCGIDLRLVRCGPGLRGRCRGARVRHGHRRQRRAEKAGNHGQPNERSPPAGSAPTIHCIHGATA